MANMTQQQQNAIRLAAWIYAAHPKLFQKLQAKANAAKLAASKTANLKGFGQCGCGCRCPSCVSSQKVTPIAGYRGMRGMRGMRLGDVTANVQLQPISISGSGTGASDVSSALTDTSSSSGGFWSGLGSDLSSLGSDVLSGVGSVGSYLTSSTGLSNLTSLANTYFASQAATAQANTQQQILQAQTQRVAAGQSPAPITYQTNAQGQLVPVYQSASGYTPLTTAGIASLGNVGMPTWLPWAAVAGIGAIVLLKVL